jgi:hypothetical protein
MKKTLCSLLSLTPVLLLITGCATRVEPELRQAVDRKLAVQRSVELDCEKPTSPFCAVQSPLIYLGSIDALGAQQHAALVEIGENALKARLHLIRAARHVIQLQNFLFRSDQTGSLIMHELVQAAKRGVRVQILFDQLFTVSDLDYLAGLALEHQNFEVRLYNPLFNKAKTDKYMMFGGVTCCFTQTNQRMHNKLLVVDDVVGMTGGLNSALESVSRSLPVFDIWPYRSTTVYELKPGAEAVPPTAGDFYQNYRPVGSFPGVISKKRRTQVILISSFLGFITPVL